MTESGRTPTRNQHDFLIVLASGNAGLSVSRRVVDPFLKHGWVTAEWVAPFYQWVRITPAGLRAVARSVEKFGLPDLGAKPITKRRVCTDCGGTRFRIEHVEVEEAVAA